MTFYSSAATHQDHDFENMESNGHTSALEKYEQESINHFGDVAIPAVAAALSLARPTRISHSNAELTNRLLGLDSDDDLAA